MTRNLNEIVRWWILLQISQKVWSCVQMWGFLPETMSITQDSATVSALHNQVQKGEGCICWFGCATGCLRRVLFFLNLSFSWSNSDSHYDAFPWAKNEELVRVRICKRLRSLGIDSASLCSLADRYTTNRVVVSARQAGLLKRLQIQAQKRVNAYSTPLFKVFWNCHLSTYVEMRELLVTWTLWGSR